MTLNWKLIDLPCSELTFDPTFEVQLKKKKSMPKVEYIKIPIQKTISTHNTVAFVLPQKIL